MKGKMIVIEACDGSGKETQTGRLFERLENEGYNIKKIKFPDYDDDSSALVKMYLGGEFGKRPGDVSPYIASTFYAVDRYASYKRKWKEFFDEGGIILADRYTTANMVHQASKFQNEEDKHKFLDWLWDFEFNIFGLPVPDCVIFLDMPPEYSMKLMENRSNKITGDAEKDIHERDIDYLKKSYKNSCIIAEKYKWNKVNCVEKDRIKSIGDIHEEIYKIVKKSLDK